jgi:STAS-like domain of unknown function (DUF4325)
MTKTVKIRIAEDFSLVPLGRFPADSDACGQNFREKFLLPALNDTESIAVDLDRTEGYGSSFLEEAFGGLVRKHQFEATDLLKRFSFTSLDDPTLTDEIVGYINDARPETT